ncbi:hypothetical protein HK096_010069 [Nowakowskiella sp. JEL0078]|nr:hypothetical protein HK096_010069 [Nowakowskiella sp. JEL0078]
MTIQKWFADASGSQIVYNGMIYQIIQPHTSQSDWTPDIVPALWACQGPESESSCDTKPTYSEPPIQDPIAPAHHAYEVKPEEYVSPSVVQQTPSYESNQTTFEQTTEEKHHPDFSNALKIGAGILGGALAIGAVGAVGYGIHEHLKHKKEKETSETLYVAKDIDVKDRSSGLFD